MSHGVFDVLVAAKRTGVAKDVLGNAPIKLPPPSLRQRRREFFSTRSILGGCRAHIPGCWSMGKLCKGSSRGHRGQEQRQFSSPWAALAEVTWHAKSPRTGYAQHKSPKTGLGEDAIYPQSHAPLCSRCYDPGVPRNDRSFTSSELLFSAPLHLQPKSYCCR